MFHGDAKVNDAIIKLSDALCEYERATSTDSVFIIRESGNYSYRAVGGKPSVPDFVKDEDLLKMIKSGRKMPNEMDKDCKPDWCGHFDCQHIASSQNMICKGKLPQPVFHGCDFNIYRFCMDTRETGHGILDLQINKTDIWNICRILQIEDTK